MAGSTFVKLACAVFLCMVVAAPHAEAAVTCGIVASKLGQCMSYLKSGGAPSGACCSGVSGLKAAASTPADRKIACNCIKTLSRGVNAANAASLPGKCGVSVPYAISPSTDCNKIN